MSAANKTQTEDIKQDKNPTKDKQEIRQALILIVDDVEQNVAVISQILRNAGHNVMAAFSGETAIRMVQKRKPDLILLDIMMPGMTGFETCEQLKASPATADIPVIFLSALTETDTKVKGFEVGGVDYITKPFQESEVLARANVHLKINWLEQERDKHIEKLTEMNGEKDRLMQIVSHDLRSPLGGIRGLAEILMESDEQVNVATVQEFSKIITHTVDGLLELVNDLLDLAKIESGKVNLNMTEFDFGETVKYASDLVRLVALKKGVFLNAEYPDEPIIIKADEPKLKQTINNLLSNAIKFTPKGGNVDIIVEKGKEKNSKNLLITVRDSGMGISEEMLKTVFEKFGDHQRNGTHGEKGSGLGLSIVKRFVELHNGTVKIESKVGEGTAFHIVMPVLVK
ncbi:MAG: hybrid sensor histidine kinase/response regulator [Bacteroidota bacterium]